MVVLTDDQTKCLSTEITSLQQETKLRWP